MEKWKYKSLEWIHKVREEDYKNTKDLSPKELIEKTRKATEETIKSLGLKIVEPKEQVRTH
ncbi:MAG: hypothetical protein AB1480_01360 [Nitrospirota bacterium]